MTETGFECTAYFRGKDGKGTCDTDCQWWNDGCCAAKGSEHWDGEQDDRIFSFLHVDNLLSGLFRYQVPSRIVFFDEAAYFLYRRKVPKECVTVSDCLSTRHSTSTIQGLLPPVPDGYVEYSVWVEWHRDGAGWSRRLFAMRFGVQLTPFNWR